MLTPFSVSNNKTLPENLYLIFPSDLWEWNIRREKAQ